MKNIQRDISIIYFVGIGGIGMSGIAEVMNALGYKVQGSDISENKNTIRLSSIGIPIIIGHDKKNINWTSECNCTCNHSNLLYVTTYARR